MEATKDSNSNLLQTAKYKYFLLNKAIVRYFCVKISKKIRENYAFIFAIS